MDDKLARTCRLFFIAVQ